MFTMIYVLLGRIAQAQLSLSGRLPSSMKDLTPELIREWEGKLRQTDGPVSSFQLEKTISDLEALLPSATGTAAIVMANKLEAAKIALEEFAPPVPVERSTMPKWQGNYTDYSDISLEALEVAHAHLMERIAKGNNLTAKMRKDYATRSALWAAKQQCDFKCAPKGTLKAYYQVLNKLKGEAKGIEYAIARAEYLEERTEVADVVTQWNTSGVPGPGGESQGEDLRRYPELSPNLDWRDLLDMSKTPRIDVVVMSQRSEALRWHDRVNGEVFTLPQAVEVDESF